MKAVVIRTLAKSENSEISVSKDKEIQAACGNFVIERDDRLFFSSVIANYL